MTDIPEQVRVSFVAVIDNSDHTLYVAFIFMARAIPNLCVSEKVLLITPNKLENSSLCSM